MNEEKNIYALVERFINSLRLTMEEQNEIEKNKLNGLLNNELNETLKNKRAEIDKLKNKKTNLDITREIEHLEESYVEYQRKRLNDISEIVMKFKKFSLKDAEEEVMNRVLIRFKYTYKWCERVYYKRVLESGKNISSIYIDLDLYLNLRKLTHDGEAQKLVSVTTVLGASKSNYIIQGGPGSGKTTISQYITSEVLNQKKKWAKKFVFPIVIRFRDMDYSIRRKNFSPGIFSIILNYFGVKFHVDAESENDHEHLAQILLAKIIDDNHFFLVLDGLDEIPRLKDSSFFLSSIAELSQKLKYGRFLLTSRTGIFSDALPNSVTYEIASLSSDQIKSFVRKWVTEKLVADKLLTELETRRYADIVKRPLNLASVCALYEKRKELPDKPRDLTKRLIELLLKDWDEARELDRISMYANFTYERKLEFLKTIAYMLTTKYKKTVFSLDDIKRCYEDIYDVFDLPPKDIKDVIEEIELHNGLFVQGGFSTFEFSHKSIQEFLVADYIVKDPFLQISLQDMNDLPNEMAIAAALSSNPNVFIGYLFFQKIGVGNFNRKFAIAFIQRLVEERADYNHDPLLAVTLSWIADNTHHDDGLDYLIESMISSSRNIQIAFGELSKFYSLQFEEERVNELKETIRTTSARLKVPVALTRGMSMYKGLSMPTSLYLNAAMLQYYFLYK